MTSMASGFIHLMSRCRKEKPSVNATASLEIDYSRAVATTKQDKLTSSRR